MSEIKLKDGRVVKTRTVRKEDTFLILEYFNGLSAKSRYFFHPCPFDGENAAAIAADAENSDTYRLVAVEENQQRDRIVGYAWIQGLKRSDIPMVGIGIIDEYQNVGLGTEMLKLLTERAKQLNLESLRLGVYDDNPRAIHVYESVGYFLDLTIPPRKEAEHTEIYMTLRIKK